MKESASKSSPGLNISSITRVDDANSDTASITSDPPNNSPNQAPVQERVVVGMGVREKTIGVMPSNDSPQVTEGSRGSGERVITLTEKKEKPQSPSSEEVILLNKPKDDPEAKAQWQAPQWASNHTSQTPEEPEEDEEIIELTEEVFEGEDVEAEEAESDDFPDIEIDVRPPQIDEAILDKIGLYEQMCDAAEKAANNKKGQEFRAARARKLRASLTNLLEDQSMDPEAREQEAIEIFDRIREILTEDEVVLAEKIEDLYDL